MEGVKGRGGWTEREREREGESDLAGDVKQNGSFSLASFLRFLHDAHLRF